MVGIRRQEPGDLEAVLGAASLFDGPPVRDATERFLASPDHHLLLAFDDEGRPVGFVSGVEVTHPDKGTELFLYELGVDEAARRQGIGTALVARLRELGRERGCHGMWVLTEADNLPALRTYRKAGATEESSLVMLGWELVEE